MECECRKHTKREDQKKKDLVVRLKRIEGQIRGIMKMVEEDVYCPDILIQVSAASSALHSFNKELLKDHLHGCVYMDMQEGNLESLNELSDVLMKLMK